MIFDGDRWSIYICLPVVLLRLSRCYLGTIISLWQIRCVLYFFFLCLLMITCEHTVDKTQTMYILAFEKWIFIFSWRNILLINWEDVGNTSPNSTLWKNISASLVSLKMLRSFIWDFVNYTTIPPGPKMDFPSFLSAARYNLQIWSCTESTSPSSAFRVLNLSQRNNIIGTKQQLECELGWYLLTGNNFVALCFFLFYFFFYQIFVQCLVLQSKAPYQPSAK